MASLLNSSESTDIVSIPLLYFSNIFALQFFPGSGFGKCNFTNSSYSLAIIRIFIAVSLYVFSRYLFNFSILLGVHFSLRLFITIQVPLFSMLESESNVDLFQSVFQTTPFFCNFLLYNCIFLPNLDKAKRPTPFAPACTLTLLFISITSYPLLLFPICIQYFFMSSESMPSPLSVIFSVVLSINSNVTTKAFASYAFLTNSKTAASSLEKFCTPKSSAIVLSSILYLRYSIFPPLKIKFFNIL